MTDSRTLPMGQILRATFGGTQTFQTMSKMAARCTDEQLQWLFNEVPDAIRSARVVTTRIQNAAVAEARKAFLAICRTGQPMSEEDFDRALAWEPPAVYPAA